MVTGHTGQHSLLCMGAYLQTAQGARPDSSTTKSTYNGRITLAMDYSDGGRCAGALQSMKMLKLPSSALLLDTH